VPNAVICADRGWQMRDTSYENMHSRHETYPTKTPKIMILTKKKMSSKEKEKVDNAARKKIGKQYGFKQSSYCNWIVKNGYFFYIIHGTFTKDADLYVKPYYYDSILWDVMGERYPDSHRAIGGFNANDFNLSRNDVPLEKDDDFTEQNCEKVWNETFKMIMLQIETFLSKNPDVDLFTFENNDTIKTPHNTNLIMMLQMMYKQKYNDVLKLATSLIENGEKGSQGWIMPDGHTKWIYEFIIDYCLTKKFSNPVHT